MRKSSYLMLCLAVLAAALLAATARAGDANEEQEIEKKIERVVVESDGGEPGEVKKVVIRKRIGDCEGDDCEGKRIIRKVVIDEDGERHEVHGDGHEWIEAHAGGPRGFLGVGLTELTPELRTHFGAPAGAGVMVAKVVAGSPAELAGVEVGDIIAAVGGSKVDSAAALAAKIGSREAGESVDLEVFRDGRPLTLSPTIESRRASAMFPAKEMREIRIECGDGEDCPEPLGDEIGYDCGDVETCEVMVECGDAGCDCRANGESIDCSEIPGFQAPSG